MYVRCNPNKTNIKYLSYVRGFRDKNGKTRQVTVEKIGNWEDLIKKYDNPVKYFNEKAPEREKELFLEMNDTFNYSLNEELPENIRPNNLGYLFLKSMYDELKINDFFKNKQKNLNIEYDLNEIFKLLIYSRIMKPGSKKETYDNKDIYFEKFDFSLKDLYRSLDNFCEYQEELETWLWNMTKDKYKRDITNSYYDCTNYYFEISYNDEDLVDEEGNVLIKGYRKKGPSKENRKDPIIQMGLLMDNSDLPLAYNLFPGNESEKKTLRPAIKKVKRNFGIERTIVVADRGLNTSDNTVFIAGKNNSDKVNHDGYIYGQSVLGGDKEFKEYVLKNDYITDTIVENNETIIFKHKSRIFAKTIQIERDGKRNNKSVVYQKQMVYYSQKYADRQKYERELVILKAKDLIANPGKYTRATSYGAANYVNNIKFDKETGLIPKGTILSLNEEKIKELEKYDGYYSIVTSELDMSDKELRDRYKGLWKIEESFKITKSLLKSRPVYVWTREHIEAHFLTCFVSLLIVRLLEVKTNKKYSIDNIINSLNELTCTNLKADTYVINTRNEITTELSSLFGLDLTKKYIKLQKIKKYIK